jgi:hypothetical protein
VGSLAVGKFFWGFVMYDHGQDVVEGQRSEVDSIGLWYDSDRLMLIGVYQDEVTAYRARRRWIDALARNFLLEERHDFGIRVRPAYGGRNFKVRCDFLTACGRYAFWRLTNHQAPEVQFLLETAHVPHLREDDLDRFSEAQEVFHSAIESELDRAGMTPESMPRLKLGVAFKRIRRLARKVLEGVFTRPSSVN